jgi:hypothetical protein
LTESVKKFIATLDESDLANATITDDTFESDNEVIADKMMTYIKARLEAAGERVKIATEQFKIEHPEYFN